jgi:hypothetical protein
MGVAFEMVCVALRIGDCDKNLGRLAGLKFIRTLWVCKRFGWALPVHGHQARHDAARP